VPSKQQLINGYCKVSPSSPFASVRARNLQYYFFIFY
jgi:hypothetical protein